MQKELSSTIAALIGFELPEDYQGPSYFVLDSYGNILEELEGESGEEQIATHLRGHLAAL